MFLILQEKEQIQKNNTPAVIHVTVDNSDKLDITVAAKGGGSENKSKFAVLNPSDSIMTGLWQM